MWKFINDEEREKFVSELLTDLSDSQELTTEGKGTILLLMIVLEDKTKLIHNAINKRLKRLARKNPALFNKLLPPPKEGFRKKPTKK